ncbi:MAG: tetratricopeptide repeat protein [Deltaproteobacteria bacterium]
MGLFGPKPYRRRDSLTTATEAQRRGKPKKAIAAYQRILDHDGEDPMILHKLAVCLAQVRRVDEARPKFLAAAAGYEAGGFADKALAVYTAAAHHIPGEVEFWERIAQGHLLRERRADAIRVLIDATKNFVGRARRGERIQLLEHVRTIDTWHVEGGLALARDLVADGQSDEARTLLDGLAERNEGATLKKVRWAAFALQPSFGSAWRWLRAAVLGR